MSADSNIVSKDNPIKNPNTKEILTSISYGNTLYIFNAFI